MGQDKRRTGGKQIQDREQKAAGSGLAPEVKEERRTGKRKSGDAPARPVESKQWIPKAAEAVEAAENITKAMNPEQIDRFAVTRSRWVRFGAVPVGAGRDTLIEVAMKHNFEGSLLKKMLHDHEEKKESRWRKKRARPQRATEDPETKNQIG